MVAPKYFMVGQFSDGLAGVMDEKSKWGFIDKKGTLVISEQFDNVQPFEDGIAFVRVGNKAGYINKEGKYVWPLTE